VGVWGKSNSKKYIPALPLFTGTKKTQQWANFKSHHAEGLVNPKVRAKKSLLILDTPEHVDSQNIYILI
jgi:hypothetical protein